MGDAAAAPVARPRIRQRLRFIALALVLLPTLALLLLVRAVAETDRDAEQRELAERRARVQDGADSLARLLGEHSELLRDSDREPHRLLEGAAPVTLTEPVDVDGRCEDWRGEDLLAAGPCESATAAFDRVELLAEDRDDYDPQDFSFSIRTGTRERYLYVFVKVVDDELILRRRDLDASDQLRLVVSLPTDGGASVPSRFVTNFTPGLEGRVTTYQVGRSWRREVPEAKRLPWGDYRLPAYRRPYGRWRPTPDGYAVELRLPLRTLGPDWEQARLGLAIVDVDRRGTRRQAMWVVPQSEGRLALRAPDAGSFARAWQELGLELRGRRLAVFDARRRELFSNFEPRLPVRERAAALLAGTQTPDASSASHADAALAVARVLDERDALAGFVLEEDDSPAPRRRLAAIVQESPLTAAILAVALLLLFLLLAYARRLSRRILALVERVDGERDADDEIGELSRRLSELIERDRAHRDYLEQLPRILGHETLGPLGVVKMFIDDLDRDEAASSDSQRQSARRAIRSIEDLIEDLREATSLEEALEQGERVEVDLVEFLRDSIALCRDGDRGPLQIDLPEQPFHTVVIERRIEQLLDKLLDNAADFSDGSPVKMSLEIDGAVARLRVENRGSQLPEGPAADQLFAPMWSARKRTRERHLGLGLYVARVIAEHHGGGLRAWNLDENTVVFEVTLKGAGT